MFPAYSFILIFFYIWKYKNIYIIILIFPYNLVEGFSFTNEPVQFTHTAPDTAEKPKVEKQKSKKNNTDILDMRKLSIVNGLTSSIDGEKLEYKKHAIC